MLKTRDPEPQWTRQKQSSAFYAMVPLLQLSPLSRSAFHVEFAVLGSFCRKAVNTYGLIERVSKEKGERRENVMVLSLPCGTLFTARCSTAMPFLPSSCSKRLNPVVIHVLNTHFLFLRDIICRFGGFFAIVKNNCSSFYNTKYAAYFRWIMQFQYI